MTEIVYPRVETREIPMPLQSGVPEARPGEPELPRILLQAAGSRVAERRVLGLMGVFVLLSFLELLLFLGIPAPEPLVVYSDPRPRPLVEPQ